MKQQSAFATIGPPSLDKRAYWLWIEICFICGWSLLLQLPMVVLSSSSNAQLQQCCGCAGRQRGRGPLGFAQPRKLTTFSIRQAVGGNTGTFGYSRGLLDLDSLSVLARLQRIRGGATAVDVDMDADSDAVDEEIDLDTSEDEDESEDISKAQPQEQQPQDPVDTATASSSKSGADSAVSTKPFTVTVKTALGNKLIDQAIELTVNRSRNIASIKESLRRQLPGRPPVAVMQLVHNRRRVADDVLIDELLDDDDQDDTEEDQEDEGSSKLVLILDMVPPVDPKFVPQLDREMHHVTTSELLDAYVTNEAALYQNAAQLMPSADQQDDQSDDSETSSQENNSLLSSLLREQAASLRQDLESTVLNTPNAQRLLADPLPPTSHEKSFQATQIRGKRVRHTAVSSVKTSLKRQIQHVFNIDWAASVRYFMLFLFFGWFGGRTPTSRAILLLGAPSVFILQARPVKTWLKQVLYLLLDDPPSIVLSLLPAPQQAILSLNMRKAMQTIYGDTLESTASEALRLETSALFSEEDEEVPLDLDEIDDEIKIELSDEEDEDISDYSDDEDEEDE